MPTAQYAQGSRGVRLALVGLGLSLFALLLIPLAGLHTISLGAALAVGGVGAAAIIQNPHLGVFAILTAVLIDVDPIGVRYLSLPYLISAVLALPLTLAILRDRTIWVWHLPQIRILFLLGILFLLSTAANYSTASFAPGSETSRLLTIFFSRMVFMLFFLYFINTREKIEITVWLVVGLISIMAIEALYGFFTKSSIESHVGQDRAHASFSLAENANRLGYICLFATSLLWFYYSYGKAHWWKPFVLPLFFFLPLTSFTTGSRSGFLQTVLLTILILKEQQGWTIRKRVRTLAFLIVAGLLAVAVVPSQNFTRATTFDPSRDTAGQASLKNRIQTDYAALKIGLSNPFLGIGIGNFRWAKLGSEGLGRASNTHNGYLWALTSGGVGVFVLYVLLFVHTYRLIKKLERSGPRELLWLSKGLKVNLLLFLLFSAFTDFWLSDFLYLLISLPLAMTLCWQREQQQFLKMRLAAKAASVGNLAATKQQRPSFPQIPSAAPARSF